MAVFRRDPALNGCGLFGTPGRRGPPACKGEAPAARSRRGRCCSGTGSRPADWPPVLGMKKAENQSALLLSRIDAGGEGVVPDVEHDELGGQLCEPDGNGAEQVVEAAMVSGWMSSPASRTTWRGATWSGSIGEEGGKKHK